MKPRVFVSSTCYDLSQVRTDLKIFIEQKLGLEPILSEYNSFPVDPNIGNVDNCLRVVKERADIFVLIVGGRYGSETDNGKSVTNLEYIHANAKGIPIYVFVIKPILNMLQVWKDNPKVNFSSVVDSPKLFEFVDALYNIDNIWVYGFDNAQDIINTLQLQLAYLFFDCLGYRNKIKISKLSNKLLGLKGEALKLALEEPYAWEYRLFGQIFNDGLNESIYLRNDLKYDIVLGNDKNLSDPQEIFDWIGIKLNNLIKITNIMGSLINNALVKAVGLPGESGDADEIVYVAERFVEQYRNIINWSLDFKSAVVPNDWKKLIDLASNVSETLISDLENYRNRYNLAITNALRQLAEQGEKKETIKLDLTLTLRAPNLSEFNEEINNLKIKYLN